MRSISTASLVTPRQRPFRPRIVPAGGDAQHAAHRGHRVNGPVSLTNRNPWTESRSSPERTRPLLLTGSPARAGVDCSPSAAEEFLALGVVRPSPGGPRRDRPGRPSCGSFEPKARTHSPVFQPSGRPEPVRSTAAGTPADMGAFLRHRGLLKHKCRCPRNRGNFTIFALGVRADITLLGCVSRTYHYQLESAPLLLFTASSAPGHP